MPAMMPPPIGADVGNPYEVLDGQPVGRPPMAYHSSQIAFYLGVELTIFCRQFQLGWVIVEGLFTVPTPVDPDRNRRPDLAFVSYDRWPANRPQSAFDNAWPIVPDLAVEVLSPTDSVRDVNDKLRDYFAAGVRRVWVIDPALRTAWEYTRLTQVRGISADESLDGGDVIPGFSLRLGELLASAGSPPI